MDLLLVPAVAILGLAAFDIVRTVLLPSSRGPLSALVYRMAFRLPALAPAKVRRRTRQFAGPAAIAGSIVMWLVLVWLGFGLVYWSQAEDLSASPGTSFGEIGPGDALYLSGTTLTTLGFGDLGGGTTTIRLVTVLQAASGLGLFTATISYLPAIYTLVSQLRGAALSAADLRTGDPDGAAEVAAAGDVSIVEAVRRDVVAVREHLVRFPVLYYFHPPVEESPLVLVRNAAGLCATLRWGVDHDRVPHARHLGAVMQESLRRLLDELESHLPDPPTPPADAPSVPGRLLGLRAALEAIDPELSARAAVPAEADAFFARVDAVLDGVARMHDYETRPVLVAAPVAARAV